MPARKPALDARASAATSSWRAFKCPPADASAWPAKLCVVVVALGVCGEAVDLCGVGQCVPHAKTPRGRWRPGRLVYLLWLRGQDLNL